MPAHNPDLATLASEALEAAERMATHLEVCANPQGCSALKEFHDDFHTKKDRALKAMRRGR